MTVTWKCDRCGTEHVGKQTVGHEFDYLQSGFGTLATSVNGYTDLCKSCMSMATTAALEYDHAVRLSKWDAVKAALKQAVN